MLKISNRLGTTCAAICVVSLVASHAPRAMAQQPTPEAIDKLLQAAEAAEAARKQEIAEVRSLLRDLAQRNAAIESQLRAAMEIQAQMLALQMQGFSDKAKSTVVEEAERIAAEGRAALDTAVGKLKGGKSNAEKELGGALEKLGELIPSDEEIATLSEEKLKELKTKIEDVKKEVDAKARDFVKGLADDLRKQCPNSDSAALIQAAQNGVNTDVLKDQAAKAGCDIGADLLEGLANARNAEEAKAAFQGAMSSMMMLAVSSGNPYVIAAVAIIMLITALFSDGGGGSGDGSADTSGNSGSEVSGGQAPDDSGDPDQQKRDDEVKPEEPKGDGPRTEVELQPGAGCAVDVANNGDTLSIAPQPPFVPYLIKLSEIAGKRPDNFPTTWLESNLTVSACDPGTQSLYVWLFLKAQANPLCYVVYNQEGKYFIGDEEYAKTTPRTCTPLQ